MGGCASKPKEIDGTVPPVEAPASPVKVDAQTVPQENENGNETQQEAPLVDLSEPKPESGDDTVEANSAEPQTVTAELDALATEPPVEPTETKVEAAEDKPQAVTTEEAKEATEVKSS
ncbi:uncharacterized protein J3R85_014125 [Psidium guajava]|nr:uncharacterized protein J3R85_014125 [Psidium guajava]